MKTHIKRLIYAGLLSIVTTAAFAADAPKFAPITIDEPTMDRVLNTVDQIAMPQKAYREIVGVFRDLEQQAQAKAAAAAKPDAPAPAPK